MTTYQDDSLISEKLGYIAGRAWPISSGRTPGVRIRAAFNVTWNARPVENPHPDTIIIPEHSKRATAIIREFFPIRVSESVLDRAYLIVVRRIVTISRYQCASFD